MLRDYDRSEREEILSDDSPKTTKSATDESERLHFKCAAGRGEEEEVKEGQVEMSNAAARPRADDATHECHRKKFVYIFYCV